MNDTVDIRRTKSGWEVVRTAPEVLGSFADRGHAELFLRALQGRLPPRERAAGKPAPAPVTPESALARPEGQAAPTSAATRLEPAADPVPAETCEPPPSELSGGGWLDSFEAALDRVEAGEALKDVAQDTGLPFGQLRGKWAAAIRNGSRTKPAPVPALAVAEAEDTPVSGGVGAVLARGGRPVWTDEMDSALLDAAEDDIDAVAARLGVSGADARRRIAAFQAEVARSLREA